MPSPPKTSAAEIVEAARALVHAHGVEGLSLNDVAAAVGVRAPSLYKHYTDRAHLLGALRGLVARELHDAARAEDKARDPGRALTAIARAIRAYARREPHLYGLLMTAAPGRDIDPAENQAMVAPLLQHVKKLVPRRTGDAARLLVAFVHGFVQMETGGAFRLGGDLDASFEFGLARIIASFK